MHYETALESLGTSVMKNSLEGPASSDRYDPFPPLHKHGERPAVPRPFRVNIPAEEVERMKRLIADTRLSGRPPVAGMGWDYYGVDLGWLKSLNDKWLFDYD